MVKVLTVHEEITDLLNTSMRRSCKRNGLCCFSTQKNTFLDVPYEAFASMEIPEILKETHEIELKTPLPNPWCLSKSTPNWKCYY